MLSAGDDVENKNKPTYLRLIVHPTKIGGAPILQRPGEETVPLGSLPMVQQ